MRFLTKIIQIFEYWIELCDKFLTIQHRGTRKHALRQLFRGLVVLWAHKLFCMLFAVVRLAEDQNF